MRATLIALAVLAATAVAGACGDSTGPNGDDSFEWSGTIAAGDQIEIKGVIGSINFDRSSGIETVVTAVKTGQDSDPATVDIQVVQHANGVTICAVYPDVPGQQSNECAPGDQGNMSVQDNDVEVTFTVQVPNGVVAVGKTITGSIDADALQSDVFASTITGNVDLVTSRLAEASVITGNVIVSLGATDWGRDLTFSAITGAITVTVPSGTNADVVATVVTGSIASDFALTDVSPGRKEGTLGTGGPTLTLSVVTGDVTLLSGS